MTFWRISAKTNELLAFILCFWHPADASTVIAGLPSAVDAVMFLLSQLLWSPSMLLFLQGSFDGVHTVLAVLLLLSFLLLTAFLLLLTSLLILVFLF
jgi:hypothetical protein